MSQSKRYDELIFNKDIVRDMLDDIGDQINKKLTREEGQTFMAYLRENSLKNWGMHKDQDIIDTLIKNFIIKYHTSKGRNTIKRENDIIDIHEIQKINIGLDGQDPDVNKLDNVNEDGIPISSMVSSSNIINNNDDDEPGGTLGSFDEVKTVSTIKNVEKITNLEKLFGFSDVANIQAIFNPSAGHQVSYLLMDTRYRLSDPDGTYKFSWNVLAGSTTSGTGVINLLNQIKNIVAIKVFPFRIPYVTAFDNTQQYKRITMLIDEFSGMAMIGQENRKFHFIFNTTNDGTMVDLSPLPDSQTCTFRFHKPITQLDSLTISFANPLSLIKFDRDRDQGQIFYENPLRIVTTNPHNLSTGDIIYISQFTTDTPIVDSLLIGKVNLAEGWNVVIPSNDNLTIQIDDIDLSTLVAPLLPFYVTLYYGSKRIFIPMEITYQNTTTSN